MVRDIRRRAPGAAAVSILVVLAVGAAAPPAAHAAVCADYPSQAAAQQAHDTIDADHDGIYCEDNPCPCSTARSGTDMDGHGGRGRHPKLGPTVVFGQVTRRSHCRVRHHRPDRRCTPGAIYAKATTRKVCRSGYSGGVRHVTESVWESVFAEYGVRRHSGATYEVDHLVPLELGGSNARANLFAEPARPQPGFHEKDQLENRLHALVCDGEMRLRRAQHLIAGDWLAAWRRYET